LKTLKTFADSCVWRYKKGRCQVMEAAKRIQSEPAP